jgi:DNA invertase Pin-like site-specific DNA recombinase
VLIVTRRDRLARSTRDLLNGIAALADFAAGALSETSGIAMSRAKKNPKLSAYERAFLNQLDCLNEEEIKQLTTREIFAYFKIIDKVDSRADVRRMMERVC